MLPGDTDRTVGMRNTIVVMVKGYRKDRQQKKQEYE
jgi:hypothetical protein